jgi:hypothetical protein
MKFLYTFLIISILSCGCDNEIIDDNVSYDGETEEGQSPITWTECGHQIGENPCDFSLIDSNGDTFNLYENYGDVLLIDFSTMWCYYCQVAATHTQSMQDQYGQYGFQYVTVLIEDNYGNTVEQSDLEYWVDTFEITTAPVLAGDRSLIDLTAENGYPISGWPTFVLINREMVLEYGVNGWSEEMVTSWVESAVY